METLLKMTVDQVGIEERAARITTRSIKTSAKREGIKLAISMIDLTTLEGKDSRGKVEALCRKAIRPDLNNPEIPSVAAVCVYPNMVALARQALSGTSVKVASVATGFPAGLIPLSLKVEETKRAVASGADEIDMVIDRGAFLSGEFQKVTDEIGSIKEACGSTHLKVILETGELETYDNIRKASLLAMNAGADFIKTSTGKVSINSTLPITLVMLEAIRDYFRLTGKRIGMKSAGGIRTSKLALHYLALLKESLGDDWLDPSLFRFGASALTNDLLMQFATQISGRYQSADYFTND
ncbi:MAG: deoxyribose-phosphate aldolase [Deltaproteobacteria bacterium]|nr:deoxyribose-phosphate aldolase [Deltaproteobacteria bacterium]